MCELDDIDKAWDNFCTGNYEEEVSVTFNTECVKPKCTSLYISTKTTVIIRRHTCATILYS